MSLLDSFIVACAEDCVNAVDSCRDCGGQLVAYSDRYGEVMPSEHFCGRCIAADGEPA